MPESEKQLRLKHFGGVTNLLNTTSDKQQFKLLARYDQLFKQGSYF